jgi:hypothetical protein
LCARRFANLGGVEKHGEWRHLNEMEKELEEVDDLGQKRSEDGVRRNDSSASCFTARSSLRSRSGFCLFRSFSS